MNHRFYRVGDRYYSLSPNILDLMIAFQHEAGRIVICVPTLEVPEPDPDWELVPPDLDVFELPFYSNNLDLIRRSPQLAVRLLRKIVPASAHWDIVGGDAPSGFGLATILVGLARRRPVFFYVRGNVIDALWGEYSGSPVLRLLVVGAIWPLDLIARLMTRAGVSTFTMGPALVDRYRGRRVRALKGYGRPSVIGANPAVCVSDPSSLRKLAYVGRLSGEKGADILLRALSQASCPPDTRLTIIGDGPERARLEHMAADLSLLDRVTFVGHVVDPAELRRRILEAGIVVVPSRTEGMPVAMLEAMALGRAIIATRVGGIPSIITPEVNGLLAEPDPEALASAIKRLVDDPELAFRLARAAAVTSRALTVDAQAKQMIDSTVGVHTVSATRETGYS